MSKVIQSGDVLIIPPTDLVDKLYKSLQLLIGDDKITNANIMLIATNSMQIVDKYKDITGTDKKYLIIYVLKKVVRDTVDDEDEDNVIMFIDAFLPSVIDTIISIDKKELAIKMKKRLTDCLSC